MKRYGLIETVVFAVLVLGKVLLLYDKQTVRLLDSVDDRTVVDDRTIVDRNSLMIMHIVHP